MRVTFVAVAFLLHACAATSITTMDGVTITEEERVACNESRDCTVWSGEELRRLGEFFFKKGYDKANEWKDI